MKFDKQIILKKKIMKSMAENKNDDKDITRTNCGPKRFSGNVLAPPTDRIK